MTRHHVGKKIGMWLLFNLIFFVIWMLGYFLSTLIYQSPHDGSDMTIRFMVSNLIAIALYALIFSLVKFFFQSKRNQIFTPMIEAMGEIANGNFKVSVNPVKLPQFFDLVQSINQMADQLHQMEEMRQEFISNVSHEIQSPLTSINGFAQALQNDHLDRQEQLHYLQIIEMESKRLSKLSENLLKLTSLESEHHPFEISRFRLDQHLKSVILLCEPQWQAKELDIQVELESATLEADENLLSQVWLNLISNSVKFTAKKGLLKVSLQSEKEMIIVRIADSGIGISANDQQHIFERFYKADRSRNRTKGGNGLGLAIVKRIVDLHQGTITVKSKLGEGTVFTVRLPRTQTMPVNNSK